MLVGTWAAAEWAIRFYRRHGFQLVAPERTAELRRAYWTIPHRQIATSVVLANPPFTEDFAQDRSLLDVSAGWYRDVLGASSSTSIRATGASAGRATSRSCWVDVHTCPPASLEIAATSPTSASRTLTTSTDEPSLPVPRF